MICNCAKTRLDNVMGALRLLGLALAVAVIASSQPVPGPVADGDTDVWPTTEPPDGEAKLGLNVPLWADYIYSIRELHRREGHRTLGAPWRLKAAAATRAPTSVRRNPGTAMLVRCRILLTRSSCGAAPL
jgi:hypothetical protein